MAAAERFAAAFLAAHKEELDERADRGRFREGHGDLRLEHVLVDGEVHVFDCVEFDPALRRIDVGADLAFLVMELYGRGAERMADELVRAYRLAGGEPGADALLSFYAAYRALVRAKLHYLEAAEPGKDDAERQRAVADGDRLFGLFERFAWRARLPLVLVVCGVTASGKTELARALSGASGLPHLASDPTRKRLAGVDPDERAPAAAYSEAFDRRTYAALGDLAREALERDGGAIVDATFRRLADRDAFRDAFGPDLAPMVFVECVAPEPVLTERAGRRSREAPSPSDATAEHVLSQLREFAPLDEIAADRHVVIRTDRPTAEVIDDLQALLDARLTASATHPTPAERG